MRRRSRLRFVMEAVEGAVVLGVAVASWPVSKRWLANWGSEPAERKRPWAGDGLVSANLDSATRAISISAPAATVWRWIVQFGLGRAGFYSYELLERFAGIPVTNLESVESSHQSLAVGDEILLHPKAGIRVALIDPERHICFGRDPESTEPKPKLSRSWSIYVEPTTDASCRLVVRSCFEETAPRSLRERIAFALEHPVDFTMEQRMLRTVKRLAEAV